MDAALKRQYIMMVVPAALLAGTGQGARLAGLIPGGLLPQWGFQALFILAAVTALAGPLMVRAWFAHIHRGSTGVPRAPFLRFQRRILLISQVTPYLAGAALALGAPKFHASAILLLALYAVYYYFPSKRRIDFDKRVFRVC